MPKHIDDILLAAGIPAEDVVKLNTVKDEDLQSFDNKPYVEKIKTNYSTQLANDPAFFTDLTLDKLPIEVKKKVESAQYGRAANITRDKFLKGLGMTEEDIADLTDEQKQKLETFIPLTTEKWTKKNASAKDIQEQLIAERKLREELQKKLSPEWEKEIETKHETKAEARITSAIFNAALIGELSSIQGLKIPAGDIAATANNILQSKYGFERIGDYSVELRQKDNKAMKVLKPNSSHELTLKDALLEIATERGWIEDKKDDSKDKGKGVVTVVTPTNGKLTMSPHIADKISQKIATEK